MYKAPRFAAKIEPPRILFACDIKANSPRELKDIKLHFCREHAYSVKSGRYSSWDPVGLSHKWADRNKYFKRDESLWWSVLAKKKDDLYKSTLRSRVNRRVRQAMEESFEKFGFKTDGTRLKDDGQPALYGTVEVFVDFGVMNHPFSEITRQTDVVLNRLVYLSGPQQVRRTFQGNSRFSKPSVPEAWKRESPSESQTSRSVSWKPPKSDTSRHNPNFYGRGDKG